MSGHTVSQNRYLSDSDGTEVELHVDADEELRKSQVWLVLSPIKARVL